MWWVERILRWRLQQPAAIRWLKAILLFAIAFVIRLLLGSVHGAIPFVTFYPAILVAAVVLGWQEASLVLALSLAAGLHFLPGGMWLLPVGWVLAAALNIAIIVALRGLAERLAEANERQRVLFEELQHRVANTLQITAGTLDRVRRTLCTMPSNVPAMLDEAIQRMSTSAQMHRCLHDPELFDKPMDELLHDVATITLDQVRIALDLEIDELELSLDQKSIIAMIVMEVASNSAKHVFQHRRGSRFEVGLRGLPGNRAILSVGDDGPGVSPAQHEAASKLRLGIKILQGLADQLHGTLVTELDKGWKLKINFPLDAQSRRKQRRRQSGNSGTEAPQNRNSLTEPCSKRVTRA